ncbi:hypothetical protein FSP39_006243 [Pinctada imbricata]|uniref:Uncharacterized protein n=1 Tax=Pinctada imbricata TaxID=66713 RepID=A0AA88YBT0_PINIB|nr:hypothetical protein FSP39_006243 [Pinctada imbricata]
MHIANDTANETYLNNVTTLLRNDSDSVIHEDEDTLYVKHAITTLSTIINTIQSNVSHYNDTSSPSLGEASRDLMWILPAIFGILIFLSGIACIVFFAIKKTEILCIQYMCKPSGCCQDVHRKRKRKSYKELEEDGDGNVEYQRSVGDRTGTDYQRPDTYNLKSTYMQERGSPKTYNTQTYDKFISK